MSKVKQKSQVQENKEITDPQYIVNGKIPDAWKTASTIYLMNYNKPKRCN